MGVRGWIDFRTVRNNTLNLDSCQKRKRERRPTTRTKTVRGAIGFGAIIAIIVGIIIVILLLTSSFGPGSITKNLNKLFFGEKAELIPKYDDTVVPGTVVGPGLPSVTITGTKERIAEQIATELAICWRQMNTLKKTIGCKELCFCSQPLCACKKVTGPEIRDQKELVSLTEIQVQLLKQEITEIGTTKQSTITGLPQELANSWKKTPPLSGHLQKGTYDSVDFVHTGLFENTRYQICAKYYSLTQGDIHITDDFTFKCE